MIKVLARAHQTMVWSRTRQTNLLRSTLREFYPAALVAFDDLTSGDALEVLRMAPTPELGPDPVAAPRSPPPCGVGVVNAGSTTGRPRSKSALRADQLARSGGGGERPWGRR